MRNRAGTSSPAEYCEWCGEPATTIVEVQPARVRTTAGRVEVLDDPIRAAVCARHAGVVTGGGPGVAPDARMRRRARGIDQLNLLGDGGPGSAIHGADG